ncbi:MAG: alpha/beta hydrolase [Patescibacteria group bacterium]
MRNISILNFKESGSGPTIVFLHGMASSLRFWEDIIEKLSKNFHCISIDLLGFGNSPKPKDSRYDYDSHLSAVQDTLTSLGVKKFTIVGHSMGALLAVRYASENPNKVVALVGFGMPIYASPEIAKQKISRSKSSLRFAYYGRSSKILCTLWCRGMRPISRRIAPIYLPNLTKAVAQDSVLHTWRSYNLSMKNIIENQHPFDDLITIKCPKLFVYGKNDGAAEKSDLIKLVNSLQIPGGHNSILKNPELAVSAIESLMNKNV